MWDLTDFADRYHHTSQLRRWGSELEFHTQCAVGSHRAREPGGERNVQDRRPYPAALPVASSVCRGCVAATMEPKCELIRLLSSQISDASNADTDASMSEPASSGARLTQSSGGCDDAMTDIEENVPSTGQEVTGSASSELPPILQLQPTFPVCEARRQDLRAVLGPAVMPHSGRRWCGLPPRSPVLSGT